MAYVTNGLQLNYDFTQGSGTQNTINDSVANRTATLTNFTLPGAWNNGLTFDGTNDYLSIGGGTLTRAALGITTQITLELFVKSLTNVAWQGLWGTTNKGSGITVFHASTGVLVLIFNNGTTNVRAEIGVGTNIYNKPLHLVVTYNTADSLAYAYVNGKQYSATPFAQSVAENWGTLYIGNSVTDDYMNGTLKGARIYNRVLSQTEVYQNFNDYFGYVTNGLQLYLDGMDFKNSPQTTVWSDRSGSNNNATTYNFAYTNVNGSDGNDNVVFTNTDYLTVPSAAFLPLINNEYTLSVYFNTARTVTELFNNCDRLISFANGSINIQLGLTSDGTSPYVYVQEGSTSAFSKVSMPLSAGWHHLVATRSLTNGYNIYVDGILSNNPNSALNNSNVYLANTGYLYIGNRGDGAYIKGTLKNVLIYNRALTQAEATQNYITAIGNNLVSNIISTTIINASLLVTKPLTGSISSVSTVNATLTKISGNVLNGNIASISTVSASLLVIKSLVSSINSVSTVNGAISKTVNLNASIQDITAITSSLTNAISSIISLNGNINSITTVNGSLDITKLLNVSVNVISAVTKANLLTWAGIYLSLDLNVIEKNTMTNIIENNINIVVLENNMGVIFIALQGDTIKAQIQFRDYSGKLYDPDSITMKVYQNTSQLLSTTTIPLSEKVSTGIYEHEYTVPTGSGSLILEFTGMVGSKASVIREKITREWVR